MSKKIIGVIVAVVVVVVLVLVFALPSTPPDDEEPDVEIKIGGIFDKTGGLAAMGALIEKGALLAVEEINAAGGVLGAKLVLQVEDGATTPTAGFEAFKKLVEVNGAKVIVGPMISGAAMSCGPYAESNEVSFVSPSASSPLITFQDWKEWAPRTCTKDNFQGQVLADIIIEEGYEAAAIVVQDTPYGIGIEMVVTEILEAANVTVVATVRYDEAKLEYATELSTIAAANPDVIVQVGYHTDSAVVYEQAVAAGLDTVAWLVAEGVYGLVPATYPAAADFMVEANLRGATLVPEPDVPEYVAFVAAYEARWGVPPGVYCDTAYDAVKMIALAIEEAGVYDGAAIKEALYEVAVDYAGASGTITWDELGDRAVATYGVWELVYDDVEEEYEYVILDYVVFE
ncbi:MAG: ABC transporter substrate-binding protein [Dehalococcoidia bacterium]